MVESVSTLLTRAEAALAAHDYRETHQLCMQALAQAPETPDAFFLLGVLTSEHDNHAKAVEIFDRAIRLAPDVARYHAWRGRSLIALNRRSEAIAAGQQAASCQPERAQTFDTIGVIFSRAGLHGQATAFYRQACARAPERADYWYNLGTAEQFQGHFEAAERALRETTRLVPGHVKAWSGLLQIVRQSAAHNDIPALEALFAQLNDADERLYIGHALAKAHEDLGQTDEAMSWLARAKARKKAEIGYSFAQDAPLFAAARDSAHRPGGAGHPDQAPIFIVGLPRTGTTLVDRILSSHSQVVSAGELTDFSLALKRATRTPSPYVLDAETLRASEQVDFAGIGRAYMASARRIVPQAPRFIDKMPLNFLCAPLIHRALPNARIICLRRHPADSVLSNYRQHFATEFSYYNYALDLVEASEYYAAFDALITDYRQHLPADRFTEVSYEAIVADLEGEARRLIAFCGLDWEPACLEFHRNAAPVATASSAQVRQPLYSSSVGRWQRYREALGPALDVLARHGLIATDG